MRKPPSEQQIKRARDYLDQMLKNLRFAGLLLCSSLGSIGVGGYLALEDPMPLSLFGAGIGVLAFIASGFLVWMMAQDYKEILTLQAILKTLDCHH